MKNLELKQQLLFCEKYSINPSELLLLEILLIAQEGDEPEIVHEYFSSRVCARGFTIELLTGLRDAGVIHKSYKIPEKGSVFNPLDVPLNKLVVKDFYKCSFDLGKELWDTYPLFGIVNNTQVGLKSVSKKFDTIEDFYRFYGKTIRWKPETHNHIIELVVKDFYKCSFDLGKELWDTYPLFGIVNNTQVGLKSVSKKFDTIEDFYRFYGKTIRWKPETHNHIIELVKWANEHNILCTTIANFVIDHKWEELEALKNEGGVNYDSMRLL